MEIMERYLNGFLLPDGFSNYMVRCC